MGGGFDAVVGNPPWEHLELKEQEFFAARSPEIANAAGALRKRLIDGLRTEDAYLYGAYQAAKRQIDGTRHFASVSGLYPLCGRGRIKTDTIFAEQDRRLGSPRGRIGIIVPTGIATDATTQFFFKDLVAKGAIAALHDFENAAPVFPDVHRSFKFSVLSLTGRANPIQDARFGFFLHDPAELSNSEKTFTLSPKRSFFSTPIQAPAQSSEVAGTLKSP